MGQARQRAMRAEIDRYHANTLCLRSNKGTRASANAEKSSVCENYIFNRATVFWTELMTFGQTNGIKWTNESGTERCGENGRARERERCGMETEKTSIKKCMQTQMEHRLLVWMCLVLLCACVNCSGVTADMASRAEICLPEYFTNGICYLLNRNICCRFALDLYAPLLIHVTKYLRISSSSSFAECEAHPSENSHRFFLSFLLCAAFSMRRTWFTLPIELIRFSAVRFSVVLSWVVTTWTCVHRKGMQSLAHSAIERMEQLLLRLFDIVSLAMTRIRTTY